MKTQKQLQQEVFKAYMDLEQTPAYANFKKVLKQYEEQFKDEDFKRTLEDQLDEKKVIEELIISEYYNLMENKENSVPISVLVDTYEKQYCILFIKNLPRLLQRYN